MIDIFETKTGRVAYRGVLGEHSFGVKPIVTDIADSPYGHEYLEAITEAYGDRVKVGNDDLGRFHLNCIVWALNHFAAKYPTRDGEGKHRMNILLSLMAPERFNNIIPELDFKRFSASREEAELEIVIFWFKLVEQKWANIYGEHREKHSMHHILQNIKGIGPEPFRLEDLEDLEDLGDKPVPAPIPAAPSWGARMKARISGFFSRA